jgi:hypothetical protein
MSVLKKQVPLYSKKEYSKKEVRRGSILFAGSYSLCQACWRSSGNTVCAALMVRGSPATFSGGFGRRCAAWKEEGENHGLYPGIQRISPGYDKVSGNRFLGGMLFEFLLRV